MAAQFNLPDLPYKLEDLEPIISKETMSFHYGKHLQTYVNQLNTLVEGTEYESMSLEDIVREAPEGPMFNNAGQVLNHTMYFLQLNPEASKTDAGMPDGELLRAIYISFGDLDTFREKMQTAALSLFGSGWAWLVQTESGALKIMQCPNGDNPLRHGEIPLLCIDVWEHAYYLDYQNRRADYIKALWNLIDWQVVAQRMQ